MSYRDLEREIREILTQDGKDVTFQHDWIDIPTNSVGNLIDIRGSISFKQLNVLAFTQNLETGEKFLLKSVVGDNMEECLTKILDFVKKSNPYNTFTVNWSKIENGRIGKQNTSFFYCHDMLEVTKKFFTGKSTKDYIIYEIKLNPIS